MWKGQGGHNLSLSHKLLVAGNANKLFAAMWRALEGFSVLWRQCEDRAKSWLCAHIVLSTITRLLWTWEEKGLEGPKARQAEGEHHVQKRDPCKRKRHHSDKAMCALSWPAKKQRRISESPRSPNITRPNKDQPLMVILNAQQPAKRFVADLDLCGPDGSFLYPCRGHPESTAC